MFRRGHRTITVSEATPEGVFKLVTASPTTADMIIMTAGGLTAFYADWTLAGIALTNHTIIDPAVGKHIGCMQRPHFQLRTDTEFLNGPCGMKCPVLWRNVAEQGTQSLTLEWDGRFSLVSFIRRSQTIWRLSEHCNNSACMHNPINNSRTARLPPNPMPNDLWSIRLQEARIASHTPTYSGKIRALLFATSATTVHVIDVPLRDGVSQLTQLSHLQILHWVNQLGPDRHVLATGRFRKTYNTNAGTPEAASAFGYTFFREHPSVFSPPNMLIRELAHIKSNENDIMGNVLVVKHIRGRKHDIVDCSLEDVQWANEIIVR
ncbi:hypothetical protein BD769DRAFT_1658653 [Suillus cothurnatus]|nr:hypothetical protein BD769DRAFT_1658653 [Suillus cothurnatus]